jgi:hypothetical protein
MASIVPKIQSTPSEVESFRITLNKPNIPLELYGVATAAATEEILIDGVAGKRLTLPADSAAIITIELVGVSGAGVSFFRGASFLRCDSAGALTIVAGSFVPNSTSTNVAGATGYLTSNGTAPFTSIPLVDISSNGVRVRIPYVAAGVVARGFIYVNGVTFPEHIAGAIN